MIIRIQGEGQYELTGDALAQLDEIDNSVLEAIDAGDEKGFKEALGSVLAHIRGNGRRLADTELKQSDIIVPPGDISLADARTLLADYPRELSEQQ